MENQGTAVEAIHPLSTDFVLSSGDLVRAQFWHFFSLWFIRVVYTVNAFAAVFVLLGVVRRGPQSNDVTGLLWLSFWFVVLPAMLVWSGWSQHRRLMAKGHTCSWRFSAQAIDTVSPLAKATLSWEAVERVVETRHAFYLFLQKRLFHVIPTGSFHSPSELQHLRALLRAKLGKKARLKG